MDNYTLENLANFRKSIRTMGDTVPNGTLTIPNGTFNDYYVGKKADCPTIEELDRIPYNDTKAWRKASRIYYSNPLYRRLLEYFANIYLNQYMVYPIFTEGKQPNKTKLMKDYNAVLRSLDEDIRVEDFTSKILLDLLIEGQTFYCIEEYKKGMNSYFKPIQLPTDRCRIIGTAGTPAVNIFAVDITFIDEIMAEMTKDNLMTRDEVLRQYPKILRDHYNQYKKGKIKKWLIIPTDKGAAFKTNDGRPPFCFLLKEIARMEKLEPLRDDYIATNMTKLLVQLIDIDKEGNPEIDLELAAEFHKNLKMVAAAKKNIDAITTLAKDVEVLTLGETGDATKQYDFLETYIDQFYNTAGVSAELFNSTSAGTLAQSQNRDSEFMRKMRAQIDTWFNFYLSTIINKKIIKNSKFIFSFLETSYNNREEVIKRYLEGAQYGFCKMVPQIALGVKQRYIASMVEFENEILDFDSKLIPLMSSHTMSAADIALLKGITPTGTEANVNKNVNTEESVGGRPAKSIEEKADGTIAKEESK